MVCLVNWPRYRTTRLEANKPGAIKQRALPRDASAPGQKHRDEDHEAGRQYLPEHQRIAIVERALRRDRGLCPHRPVFQFVRKFDDVAKTLRRIDVESLADDGVEPGRQVRTVARQRDGFTEARARK